MRTLSPTLERTVGYTTGQYLRHLGTVRHRYTSLHCQLQPSILSATPRYTSDHNTGHDRLRRGYLQLYIPGCVSVHSSLQLSTLVCTPVYLCILMSRYTSLHSHLLHRALSAVPTNTHENDSTGAREYPRHCRPQRMNSDMGVRLACCTTTRPYHLSRSRTV